MARGLPRTGQCPALVSRAREVARSDSRPQTRVSSVSSSPTRCPSPTRPWKTASVLGPHVGLLRLGRPRSGSTARCKASEHASQTQATSRSPPATPRTCRSEDGTSRPATTPPDDDSFGTIDVQEFIQWVEAWRARVLEVSPEADKRVPPPPEAPDSRRTTTSLICSGMRPSERSTTTRHTAGRGSHREDRSGPGGCAARIPATGRARCGMPSSPRPEPCPGR